MCTSEGGNDHINLGPSGGAPVSVGNLQERCAAEAPGPGRRALRVPTHLAQGSSRVSESEARPGAAFACGRRNLKSPLPKAGVQVPNEPLAAPAELIR